MIVCQRWCHSEKTDTGIITFDLDMISSWVFFKIIFGEGVSVEEIKLHAFSGVQYRYKEKEASELSSNLTRIKVPILSDLSMPSALF